MSPTLSDFEARATRDPAPAPAKRPSVADNQSCLVAKVSQLIDMSDLELSALSQLQTEERSFARDEVLFSVGDHHQDLYIVQEGWLFNAIDAPDGRRQIVNIYHPGDIIGFPDIALSTRTTDLVGVTAGSICPFPKSGLGTIFREAPRLAALLLSIALREETVLIDRLRVFSRSSAQARVAYLFLELNARLRCTTGSDDNTLYMPLNQHEIGDSVGLTNVSVSRAVTALEERGLIATASREVRLLDMKALIEMCDFEDRYAQVVTDWFP